MTYQKRFVCLANSRKWSGRCVAGLEIDGDTIGPWLRPVSDRPTEELSLEDRRYSDGSDVRLLDVIDVHLKQHRPHACQTENHVIDDQYHWVRTGTFTANRLIPQALDRGPLWVDGHSSYAGRNDRIPIDIADALSSSLALVAPDAVMVQVVRGFKKRQARLAFRLATSWYNLTVTDPRIESEYLRKDDGDYPRHTPTLLCVSLGEPFDGYRYKLAAAVIDI